MATNHLAYPGLASDNFFGTDHHQDVESFIQVIERKINFPQGDAPANPDALAKYTFRKKALFPSLLMDQQPTGTRVALKLLTLGTTLGQVLLLNFQMAEIDFAIGWKLNTVFEEMARKIGTFSTELKEQWIKAGAMTWVVSQEHNNLLSGTLRPDKEDSVIWTTVYEDSDRNMYSGKPKSI